MREDLIYSFVSKVHVIVAPVFLCIFTGWRKKVYFDIFC